MAIHPGEIIKDPADPAKNDVMHAKEMSQWYAYYSAWCAAPGCALSAVEHARQHCRQTPSM
jgi:hypothetical protein